MSFQGGVVLALCVGRLVTCALGLAAKRRSHNQRKARLRALGNGELAARFADFRGESTRGEKSRKRAGTGQRFVRDRHLRILQHLQQLGTGPMSKAKSGPRKLRRLGDRILGRLLLLENERSG